MAQAAAQAAGSERRQPTERHEAGHHHHRRRRKDHPPRQSPARGRGDFSCRNTERSAAAAGRGWLPSRRPNVAAYTSCKGCRQWDTQPPADKLQVDRPAAAPWQPAAEDASRAPT